MRRSRRVTYGLGPLLAALAQFAYQRHHPFQDTLSVTHAFLAIAPVVAIASGIRRRARPLDVMVDVAVATLLAYLAFLLAVLLATIVYFETCSADC